MKRKKWRLNVWTISNNFCHCEESVRKKDVIKVAKLHAKKMIRACQEAEKLCKILMTARKLHSMKLSCQRDSILVAIKTKLQVAIGGCP